MEIFYSSINLFFWEYITLFPIFTNKTEVTGLPGYISKKQVNLGLDLQGGSHLLLEVDTRAVLKERSEYLVDELRSILRKK